MTFSENTYRNLSGNLTKIRMVRQYQRFCYFHILFVLVNTALILSIHTLVFFSSFPIIFSVVYIEMIDLLRDFDDPAVMDLKMGIRYYMYISTNVYL